MYYKIGNALLRLVIGLGVVVFGLLAGISVSFILRGNLVTFVTGIVILIAIVVGVFVAKTLSPNGHPSTPYPVPERTTYCGTVYSIIGKQMLVLSAANLPYATLEFTGNVHGFEVGDEVSFTIDFGRFIHQVNKA